MSHVYREKRECLALEKSSELCWLGESCQDGLAQQRSQHIEIRGLKYFIKVHKYSRTQCWNITQIDLILSLSLDIALDEVFS